MKIKLTSLMLLLFVAMKISAQDDIKKMVPPSPTAAALGEYGSVPVNFNTGMPNVSVPLYEIKGKDIGLSVDLSYHGGGMKVSEVSSWIGLGWSLNAGGVITRDTRGLPDDGSGGYFSGTTIPSDTIRDPATLLNVANGLIDLEPDVFYFNFAGKSGSFIYDKVNDRFRTIPESRLSISAISTELSQDWQVVAEDGTKYLFTNKELSLTSNSCNPSAVVNSVITGWYLTKIVNYNKTDSIQFEYATPYTYHYYLRQGHTKCFVTYFQPGCSAFGDDPSDYIRDCILETEITAQRLTRITYRDGSVEFHASTASRCDLTGDYSLDRIDIKDRNSGTIYSYDFSQSYFSNGATPCASGADMDNFRLKLDSVNRVTGSTHERYRNFEYTTGAVPHRQAFSQDYWGYYNGAANSTLIPTQVFLTDAGPISYPGANRSPSESASLVGSLKKIIYPTGGSTEFTYENNRADGVFLPEVTGQQVHLDQFVTPSSTRIYTVSFTIDEDPNPLNAFNAEGGVFASYLIDGITCDYDGPDGHTASNDCALITLSGTTGYSITGNLNNAYLPNGSYTLTADFSHNFGDTATWKDFYVRALWYTVDTLKNHNSIIGGLRIKKISDYDPYSGKVFHQKLYDYRLLTDTTKSSTWIGFMPAFSRSVAYVKRLKNLADSYDDFSCIMQTLSTSSNFPIVGLGLKLGYKNVTVTDDSEGSNGKTVYMFTNTQSYPDTDYPFTPTEDYSWKSGELEEQKDYVKSGDDYLMAHHVRKTFRDINDGYVAGMGYGPKISIRLNTSGAIIVLDHNDYYFDSYQSPTGFFYNDSTITRTYNTSTGEYLETYELGIVSSTHYNVVYQEASGHAGEKIATRLKYTDDFATPTATDNASKAIIFQKDHHINDLIEKTTWKKSGSDSTLLASELSLYELRSGLLGKSKVLHLPVPSSFSPSTITSGAFSYAGAYESVMDITHYDGVGNVTEGKGRDGTIISYLWDAPGVHPVAQVIGAEQSEVSYTGFEDDTSGTSSTAYAGAKSHSGSYTVSLPGSGTKKLTYWKKVGSGAWQFIETTMSSSATIGTESGALVDEVRVYPAGAQVTTYTYKPGVGVSSVTDPNNVVSYYEYDSFSRLQRVKDKDGNILKMYQYNYKQNSTSGSGTP